MVVCVIPSVMIVVGLDISSTQFNYGLWPVNMSEKVLKYGKSLDYAILCAKFIECLICNSPKDCLNQKNMKLFSQQYVAELWMNKYF